MRSNPIGQLGQDSSVELGSTEESEDGKVGKLASQLSTKPVWTYNDVFAKFSPLRIKSSHCLAAVRKSFCIVARFLDKVGLESEMDASRTKTRLGHWFCLIALVAMFGTSSGCALFEPEPEKPLTVEEVMKQPRLGMTKYSKTKSD